MTLSFENASSPEVVVLTCMCIPSVVSGVVKWINDHICCKLSEHPPDFCSDWPGSNPGWETIEAPQTPGKTPAGGTIPVMITLLLDDYPKEVGLLLYDKGLKSIKIEFYQVKVKTSLNG